MQVCHFDHDDEIVRQPFKHIRLQGLDKNNFMVQIWEAFNHWINCPQQNIRAIARILTACLDLVLLVDDIQDGSKLRRGAPAAHLIFGVSRTLHSVYFAKHIALKSILSFQDTELVDCFVKVGLQIYTAYSLEEHFRKHCLCPTEEEYLEIAAGRSTAPFIFSVRFTQLFSENKQDFGKLTSKLGVLGAIGNDYSTFKCQQYMDVHGFCDDLTAGVFSFPMIHAIRSHPEDTRVLDLIRERTSDIQKKRLFVQLLEQFGSLAYTKEVIHTLKDECLHEIQKLGKNEMLETCLEDSVQDLDLKAWYDIVYTSN